MKLNYHKISILAFILSTLWLISCDKEITLDLDTPTEKLVVEGGIEMVNGTSPQRQTLKLSLLNDFFRQEAAQRANGATVWVEDHQGNRHDYHERAAGQYECTSLQVVEGGTYTLNIEWMGQQFQASQTMVAGVAIDSVYQVFEEENLFEDGGLKTAIDFTDPAGTANYYRWQTYINGELFILPDPGNSQNLIAKDDFFDGQQIVGYLPNEEALVEPGQEVTIRQINLTEDQYDFYFLLFEEAGKTGQLIDTPPAPIRGNIVNLTNPENYPLGYFGVNQVSERTVVVKQQD